MVRTATEYRPSERILVERILPDEQRWDASRPSPKDSLLRVDQQREVVRLLSTTDGRTVRLTHYENHARPAAYLVDTRQKKLAVLQANGSFGIYDLAGNRYVAGTAARAKDKMTFAKVAPAVATALLGAAVGHTQLSSAHPHLAIGAGVTVGAAMLLHSASEWISEKRAAKARVKEVVVQQSVAFAKDGSSFDRVVPGGVMRLDLKSKRDIFVRAKVAADLPTLTPRLRTAMKRAVDSGERATAKAK